MLTVACCLWGQWPAFRVGGNPKGGNAALAPKYVQVLRNAVKRNLSVPHRFICFCDDRDKVPYDIEYLPLDVPWFKRGLPKAYVYGAPFTGCPFEKNDRILIFDLDNVITGSIDDLAAYSGELCVRERGYMLNRGVKMPDGDMISVKVGSSKAKAAADLYFSEMESKGAATGGDERELLRMVGADMWIDHAPNQIFMYKRHCKSGLPSNARVVSFCGRPLPDQVNHDWVRRHWR